MGQACANCLSDKPMAVNDDMAAGSRERAKQFGALSARNAQTPGAESDSYATGAITNSYSGLAKPDPNYSSQEIGIEDF